MADGSWLISGFWLRGYRHARMIDISRQPLAVSRQPSAMSHEP